MIKKKKQNKIAVSTEIKRPRGRPRKNPLPTEPIVKRPRGRPRKNPLPITAALPTVKKTSHGKYGKPVEPLEPSNMVISAFLGHCPQCKTIVGQLDIEKGTKNIFNCASCGERADIETLIKKLETDRPKTKREYLEQSILLNSDYEPRTSSKAIAEELPHEIIDTISTPAEKDDEDIEIDE